MGENHPKPHLVERRDRCRKLKRPPVVGKLDEDVGAAAQHQAAKLGLRQLGGRTERDLSSGEEPEVYSRLLRDWRSDARAPSMSSAVVGYRTLTCGVAAKIVTPS